jgi:hypothetical protein
MFVVFLFPKRVEMKVKSLAVIVIVLIFMGCTSGKRYNVICSVPASLFTFQSSFARFILMMTVALAYVATYLPVVCNM